jgi:uncharacterized protein (TIGR03435 family)
MTRAALWPALFLAASCLSAQTPSALPTFDAASIKPNNSGTGGSSTNGSKGQIVFTNVSLKRLVERAYDVKPFQVTGPDFMETVHFDIAAKYPPGTKAGDRPLMLRALLGERFKLAVHFDSKEVSGYGLVVAKSGFKLKPVEPGGSNTKDYGGRIRTLTAKKTSMAFLADLLARILNEVVIDKTGIDGVYDFDFRWTADDVDATPSDGDPAPSLFTAIQETLGLRLQPQKVPVQIVIVDHIERVPIEN